MSILTSKYTLIGLVAGLALGTLLKFIGFDIGASILVFVVLNFLMQVIRYAKNNVN